MASLLGEPVGHTVGYSVRGDRKTSRHTRIEVVTSGLLVRRLQHDQELKGVGTVLLDEVHERHLDADLLLALLLDAKAGLRPDLKLLATCGNRCRATTLRPAQRAGPAHRVAHVPDAAHLRPTRAQRAHRDHASPGPSDKALSEVDGDVLAFLPGVGEINRTASLLNVGEP